MRVDAVTEAPQFIKNNPFLSRTNVAAYITARKTRLGKRPDVLFQALLESFKFLRREKHGIEIELNFASQLRLKLEVNYYVKFSI